MLRKRRKNKLLGIFRPSSLKQLRDRNFTGNLSVRWKDGKIEEAELETGLRYRRYKKEHWFDEDF